MSLIDCKSTIIDGAKGGRQTTRLSKMIHLPAELKLKILSYLTRDFKSLEALQEVFPDDLLIKQLSQACQLIILDSSKNLSSSRYYRPHRSIHFDNIHKVYDILSSKEEYFQYPVELLSLTSSNRVISPGHLEDIRRTFDNEPNLLKVRVLHIDDVSWDVLNLLFLNISNPSDVRFDYKTIFHNVEELVLNKTLCSEIPILPNLRNLVITADKIICGFTSLNKLRNLKKLCLWLLASSNLNIFTPKLKLPKLEYLGLSNCVSNIEDNFDKNLPNLKTLDLTDNALERIPKFAMTSLEELHFTIAKSSSDLPGSKFENLSTLKNLKKLIVKGHRFRIDEISQLQNLEHLELKSGFSGMIELDGNLPKNIKVLSLDGFKLIEIKNMPVNLQKLKLSSIGKLTIESLNADLSVLSFYDCEDFKIMCDVSYLTKIEIEYKLFTPTGLCRNYKSFTFNDDSSFQLVYKALDHFSDGSVYYKYSDVHRQPRNET